MDNKKLALALFSSSVDKLTAAGVILGGAAADDICGISEYMTSAEEADINLFI